MNKFQTMQSLNLQKRILKKVLFFFFVFFLKFSLFIKWLSYVSSKNIENNLVSQSLNFMLSNFIQKIHWVIKNKLVYPSRSNFMI